MQVPNLPRYTRGHIPNAAITGATFRAPPPTSLAKRPVVIALERTLLRSSCETSVACSLLRTEQEGTQVASRRDASILRHSCV